MWEAIGVVDEALSDGVPQQETGAPHDKLCDFALA
jgi:hypothetical protein